MTFPIFPSRMNGPSPGSVGRAAGGDDERVVCVIYTIARCPYCDSHRAPTYDRKEALKYRRCSDSGKTFKSVVQNYEPDRD